MTDVFNSLRRIDHCKSGMSIVGMSTGGMSIVEMSTGEMSIVKLSIVEISVELQKSLPNNCAYDVE